MKIEAIAPAAILSAIGLCFLMGALIPVFGARLARKSDWVAVFGVFALGISIVLGWIAARERLWEPISRHWEWYSAGNAPGAPQVGYIIDPLTLTIVGFYGFLVLAVLVYRQLLGDELRAERLNASLLLSVAGVAVAWIGMSTWLVLLGGAIVIASGFVSLSTRSDVDADEARYASRYLRETIGALLIALIGSCILASIGAEKRWDRIIPWDGLNETRYMELVAGTSSLIFGLFYLGRAFPLLGWIGMQNRMLIPVRFLVIQFSMNLIILSVLVRLYSQLNAVGVLPVFGTVALVCSLLASFAGLFQRDWRRAVLLASNGGLGLWVAVLALAGPKSAMPIVIGFGLGFLSLSYLATIVEKGGAVTPSTSQKAIWLKALAFISAMSVTGVIGFVTAGGLVSWFFNEADNPASVLPFAVVFLPFTVLAWKLAWMISRLKSAVEVEWTAVLPPLLLSVAGLNFFWDGTFFGAYFLNDRVLSIAIFDLFSAWLVGGAPAHELSELVASPSLWIYTGTLLLGFVASYWSERTLIFLERRTPTLAGFIADGYGVDRLTRSVAQLLKEFGGRLDDWITVKLWKNWLTVSVGNVLGRAARGFSHADEQIGERINRFSRRGVEVPAKVLQLVQNGNLQWYVFFAVGVGVALLLHFLKYKG